MEIMAARTLAPWRGWWGCLCNLLARMDSGYVGENTLRWLEEDGVGYVVKMKMKRDLWSIVLTLSRAA